MSSSSEVDAFWDACATQGVVSKQLTFHRAPHTASPVGLTLQEAAKHGAPLINVPYNIVLNGQTLRGDMLPRALPPLRKMVLFLTRRGRMGSITAHSLWLATFVACYREQCLRASSAPPVFALSPLLGSSIYPSLPNLFTAQNALSCASLRSALAAELLETEERVLGEMDLTHAMLRHYTKRRGISPRLCPDKEALLLSYRTVMQRALLLPWNCEPSAPGDVAELMESTPDLPLLPSLVPVIDMIRPAPAHTAKPEKKEADEGEDTDSSGGNCALLTCVQSDFLSASSRRRVVVEIAPLAARRVVVCATKPIKAGEELFMDCE